MEELIGTIVEVKEASGYTYEGILDGFTDGLIPRLRLRDCRQINYVDEEQRPQIVESWDLPGLVYVALHAANVVHATHLPAKGRASGR